MGSSIYEATAPAISVVSVPITQIIGSILHGVCREVRIIKIIPAVTRVEEWTSADTGVGAAIASGSHKLNGICALLVAAAIIIKITPPAIEGGSNWVRFHLPWAM